MPLSDLISKKKKKITPLIAQITGKTMRKNKKIKK